MFLSCHIYFFALILDDVLSFGKYFLKLIFSSLVLFSTSELIELAILFQKTKASSREFEASLFAPCAPVEETSPHAHRPFIDDFPFASTRTPPI